jgi:hypothetical protein
MFWDEREPHDPFQTLELNLYYQVGGFLFPKETSEPSSPAFLPFGRMH